MGKKKNKIAKLTEEQYYAYIAGLKNEGAPFGKEGSAIVSSPFKANEKQSNKTE